jgi:TRAP-type C4-dicarboxylate transport system substrate-binding protein
MRGLPVVAAALMAFAPLPVVAETYNATVVTGHPPVFRWVRMLDEAFYPAVNEALAANGHEIAFDGQYGGSIATVGEELEIVEVGLAELGVCSTLFDPAKLGPQNVTYYTPFVSDDAREVGYLMDRLHDELPELRQAYLDNGNTYLGAPVVVDDYLIMTNFPVNGLADLKSRRIAAPGAAVNWLIGTGAVGVSGNLTTYYNDLSTGVYEGVIVFASAALPGNLHDVAPYITRVGLGAQFAGGICANTDWFEGLPHDVQDALLAGADAARDWYIADLEQIHSKRNRFE